jgi:hypothetical protein
MKRTPDACWKQLFFVGDETHIDATAWIPTGSAKFWNITAYWFTASTSFANPALTPARAAANAFAGIRPVDVSGFGFAELMGAAVATLFAR